MTTNQQAFEQQYTSMLLDYYGGEYVPLLTEGFTKTTPQQVYADFEEELVEYIAAFLAHEIATAA